MAQGVDGAEARSKGSRWRGRRRGLWVATGGRRKGMGTKEASTFGSIFCSLSCKCMQAAELGRAQTALLGSMRHGRSLGRSLKLCSGCSLRKSTTLELAEYGRSLLVTEVLMVYCYSLSCYIGLLKNTEICT